MELQTNEDNRFPFVSRRRFIKVAATTAALLPGGLNIPSVHGSVAGDQEAETHIGELYRSFSKKQKRLICFQFDHQKRHKISANWHVTKPVIGDDFYTRSQRAMIDKIVRNVTSEDGYERLTKQMASDTQGGINGYSIAIFGEPGNGDFQWEMTGRHLTMRADGNSVDKAAFGGPIVYGHGVANPKRNLFYYQTEKTNEVFHALDPDQAKKALLQTLPTENDLRLRNLETPFAGIGIDELANDQKQLVEDALKVLLAPYRTEDVDEVFELIKSSGGFDSLSMSFYRDNDLGNDEVWDMWRIEGPGLVWHFRGAPHVHAYINIEGAKTKTEFSGN